MIQLRPEVEEVTGISTMLSLSHARATAAHHFDKISFELISVLKSLQKSSLTTEKIEKVYVRVLKDRRIPEKGLEQTT